MKNYSDFNGSGFIHSCPNILQETLVYHNENHKNKSFKFKINKELFKSNDSKNAVHMKYKLIFFRKKNSKFFLCFHKGKVIEHYCDTTIFGALENIFLYHISKHKDKDFYIYVPKATLSCHESES